MASNAARCIRPKFVMLLCALFLLVSMCLFLHFAPDPEFTPDMPHLRISLQRIVKNLSSWRTQQDEPAQQIGQVSSTKVGSNVTSSRRALANLSAHIQRALHRLQSPSDCWSARLLICDMDTHCGFGCLVHHIGFCLAIAAASNRTVLLQNDGMRWAYEGGWSALFQPITKCRFWDQMLNKMAIYRQFAFTDPDQMSVAALSAPAYSQPNQTERILRLPIVGLMDPAPEHRPLAMPVQFAEYLQAHHSNPPVWFYGQILKFLWHFNPRTREAVERMVVKVPFDQGPIVGIHIRRTDKLIHEAKFHSLDEYMKWAELWFADEERRKPQQRLVRRLFIASDDPKVFEEARRRYANTYQIYSTDSARKATTKWHYMFDFGRYSRDASLALLAELQMLVRCAHVVCTFSSNICRLVYELRQAFHQGDEGRSVSSLDDLHESHYQQNETVKFAIFEEAIDKM